MRFSKKTKAYMKLLEGLPPTISMLVIAFKFFDNPVEYIKAHYSDKLKEHLIKEKWLTRNLRAGERLKSLMKNLNEKAELQTSVSERMDNHGLEAAQKLMDFYKSEYRKKFGYDYYPTNTQNELRILGRALKRLGRYKDMEEFLLYFLDRARNPSLVFIPKWIDSYVAYIRKTRRHSV